MIETSSHGQLLLLIVVNVFVAAVILCPRLWKKFLLIALLALASFFWWRNHTRWQMQTRAEAALRLAVRTCNELDVLTAKSLIDMLVFDPTAASMMNAWLESELNRRGCGAVSRGRELTWRLYGLRDETDRLDRKTQATLTRMRRNGSEPRAGHAPEADWPTGMVRVLSDPPGATIRVDGYELGVTPMDIEVGAGRSLVGIYKEGYARWWEYVDIEPRGSVTVRCQLGKSPRPSSGTVSRGLN